MERRTRWIAGGALALVTLGAGTGIAVGVSGDADPALTGTRLERATQAALAFTGGGSVVESEAGDDGAAYSVEVEVKDGSVIEIRMDRRFQVIGHETDEDTIQESVGHDAGT